jgi:hypothetical protein
VAKILRNSHISSEDSQKSDSDEMEWWDKVSTDKGCAHQFVGENSALNKTTVQHSDTTLQPLAFLVLFTEYVFPLSLQETNLIKFT